MADSFLGLIIHLLFPVVGLYIIAGQKPYGLVVNTPVIGIRIQIVVTSISKLLLSNIPLFLSAHMQAFRVLVNRVTPLVIRVTKSTLLHLCMRHVYL